MKLVLLVNDMSGGHGWSTYARNIACEAVRNGHEVHALVHEPTTDIAGIMQHAILPGPHDASWNPLTIARVARSVAHMLQKVSPDVVHVVVEPYIQCWSMMPRPRYRLILTLHGTYACLPATVPRGVRRAISHAFFWRALRKVDAVIAVSERTKESFSEYARGRFKGVLHVIHNSIALPAGAVGNVGEHTPHLSALTVGAVKRRKGIHTAIRYLSAWSRERMRHLVYHVVGQHDASSGYGEEVRVLAEQCAHEYFTVVLHGSVSGEEKEMHFNSADLYIHLEDVRDGHTDVEGFGISIIEAAAYGVPALVAQGSATAEAVHKGVSGYIVNLGSEDEVFGALDAVLLEERISKTSVFAWAQEHSAPTMYRHVEALYNAHTESRPR